MVWCYAAKLKNEVFGMFMQFFKVYIICYTNTLLVLTGGAMPL